MKFLLLLFMTAGSVWAGSAAGPALPNVVLLFVDDLGYADVGYNGCTDIPTPHIDSIAQNGIICEQGYVCAPVCAPSRAGLLTGRCPTRFGFEDTPGPFIQNEQVEIGIPLAEKNMAERLKPLGYRTGIVGKWHEGRLPQYQPHRRGFDETFYFTDGWTHYFKQENPLQNIKRGDEPVDLNGEYTTDAFGREAAAFIERHKDRPFFLYVPFSAPHVPLEAKPEHLEKFAHIEEIGRRTLASMVWSLDENIGRILQTLEKYNLTKNTLVIFISDNGGKPGIPGKIETGGGAANFSMNTPLKGKKGQLYEGGIRVPFCMQWPARLPAGTTFEHPVITLDILPTLLAAAGKTVPAERELDGTNLLPYLAGTVSGEPHQTLYWRFLHQWAVRSNGWKLIQPKEKPPELYRLSDDPNETTNVISQHPQTAAQLKTLYEQWNGQMMQPRWSWIPAFGGPVRIPADDPRRQW